MLTYTQLAQARFANTTPASIYQSSSGQQVQVFVKICNVSSAEVLLRFFHDTDGTTFDESTAIVWDMELPPGYTLELDHIFIDNPAGNLAYRTSVASALTVTVYGAIKS